MQAVATEGVHGKAPPRLPSVPYPTPYMEAYAISAVVMERTEVAADASFAASRDLTMLGIAMAAMIRMMATTISSSTREKPLSGLAELAHLSCVRRVIKISRIPPSPALPKPLSVNS